MKPSAKTILKIKADYNLSNQQAADYCNLLLNESVLCSEARPILQATGLCYRELGSANAIGPLIATISAMPAGESKTLASWFVDHVYFSGVEMPFDGVDKKDATIPAYKFITAFFGLVSALVPSELQQPLITAFTNAGSGKKYEEITEADVVTILVDHETELVLQEQTQLEENTLNFRVGKINDTIAAIRDQLKDPDATKQEIIVAFTTELNLQWVV